MNPLRLDSSLDPIPEPTGHDSDFPSSQSGLERKGSRAPLQRRSHVLQAAEANGGVGLPEPSWDMIAAAEAQDKGETAALRKGQKRVLSELTPIPGDADEEPEENDAPSSRKVSRKKGRSSESDSDDEKPESPAPTDPPIKDAIVAAPSRRSTRQPQKQTRRS